MLVRIAGVAQPTVCVSKRDVNGLLMGHRRTRAEWPVFIADHHEGYIPWEQYERNQRVMADNANSKGLTAVRGPIRRGSTLLNGLLRCGHWPQIERRL